MIGLIKSPPMILSATELFDNLAKLIPPPHRHRHHYHGVLAPNSKYRAKVTQFANEYYRPDTSESVTLQATLHIEAVASQLIVKSQQKVGSKNWGRLIAKVYEVDPLKCGGCGGEMKLIALLEMRSRLRKYSTILVKKLKRQKCNLQEHRLMIITLSQSRNLYLIPSQTIRLIKRSVGENLAN